MSQTFPCKSGHFRESHPPQHTASPAKIVECLHYHRHRLLSRGEGGGSQADLAWPSEDISRGACSLPSRHLPPACEAVQHEPGGVGREHGGVDPDVSLQHPRVALALPGRGLAHVLRARHVRGAWEKTSPEPHAQNIETAVARSICVRKTVDRMWTDSLGALWHGNYGPQIHQPAPSTPRIIHLAMASTSGFTQTSLGSKSKLDEPRHPAWACINRGLEPKHMMVHAVVPLT